MRITAYGACEPKCLPNKAVKANSSLPMLAEMRRGLKALNSVFGNKIAILAGDFLLARASVSLAALRDSEVIQLLSQVIEDLVTGEILQVCTSMCCRPALLTGLS